MSLTTTKKSHATIPLAWLWTKASQRFYGSEVRHGRPLRKYFPTVRGETRIPSFSLLAIRPSPPGDVVSCHLSNQLPEILGWARPPQRLRLPAPEESEPEALPTNERICLDIQ